jgi:hypothetical protein
MDSQPRFLENPRKSPRVPVELTVELTYGTATWNGLALDFGPGGCLVYAGKPLAIGERLHAAFRNRDLAGRLTVDARVAWTRAGRSGIAFVPGSGHPQTWFEQLLRKRPSLANAGAPPRIALDARVSRLMPPLTSQPLPREEASVLSAIGMTTPVRLVALHSRVPPQRFARALYALLEKGLVAIAPGVSPVPEASPASRGDAA